MANRRNKQISENEEEIRGFYCLAQKNEEEIRKMKGKKFSPKYFPPLALALALSLSLALALSLSLALALAVTLELALALALALDLGIR